MTSLARAHSFTVSAGVFTEQGGAAGSKCGKQEDEDTDLATVQKGPYVLDAYVLPNAHICNHFAYIGSVLFFIASIYIAYCNVSLSTMNLHVTYILYHILCIMYIAHIVHIYA